MAKSKNAGFWQRLTGGGSSNEKATPVTDGDMPRRDFLQTLLGATAATALVPETADAQTKNFKDHNLFELLSKPIGTSPRTLEFIGRDGKVVNIGALKDNLKGRLTTVCYGFADCDTLCPYVNAGLAALGRRAKAKNVPLTSIFIAVMPEIDGASQQARDHYVEKLKQTFKLPQDVVILFPSRSGKVSKESAKDAALLSLEMGNIVDMTAPAQHSVAVTLYDSTGKCIDKKIGNTTPKFFADALDKNLDTKNIIGGIGARR
jgi:cytochrome oxidase Cu insertion factor (SCO1/SenC/PrrC family)